MAVTLKIIHHVHLQQRQYINKRNIKYIWRHRNRQSNGSGKQHSILLNIKQLYDPLMWKWLLWLSRATFGVYLDSANPWGRKAIEKTFKARKCTENDTGPFYYYPKKVYFVHQPMGLKWEIVSQKVRQKACSYSTSILWNKMIRKPQNW